MKHVCLALLCLLCAACSNFDNPIIGEKGPAFDEALVGHWAAEKDGSRLEVAIARNGDEGKIHFTSTESGKEPETGEARLVTARIEQNDFGSLQEQGAATSTSWRFFRYQLSAPGKLTIYLDDDAFWTKAVNDKQVAGQVACQTVCSASISASSEELRALVQGYGPVIFKEEPVVELTRE